jgi:alkylated DNA repair dioxygenase AlkB
VSNTPSLPKLFPTCQTLLDDTQRGAWVTYEENFLAPAEVDVWMSCLLDSLPFVQESPVMFGKPMPVRRKSCAMGDHNTRYRYSGIEREASAWIPGFEALVARLNTKLGVRFNFALCNFYEDGGVGLGWHADDESDLVDGAPIASLSLGAARDFALRLGKSGSACTTVNLASGSLLVMGGTTQRYYQHRVPLRVRCREARLNLTFRVIGMK